MDFTKKKINPDKEFREEFLNYVKSENEEQYNVYEAINSIQFRYVTLRKEGKSHKEVVAFLTEQEA